MSPVSGSGMVRPRRTPSRPASLRDRGGHPETREGRRRSGGPRLRAAHPIVSDTGRMVPEALGGPTTSTCRFREPDPKLFEAVTSIVVLPAPTGVTLSAASE